MANIEAFERMLAQGQDGDMLRFTLGNAYFTAKDFEHAIEHLRAAVDFNKDYSVAWKVLGRAFHAVDDYAAALAAFDAGIVAAETRGDKQTEKEILVFRKRTVKALESAPSAGNQPVDSDAPVANGKS